METADKAQVVVEPLVISVRQPWAWLIIHAGKDIENRDWPTLVRGRVLIQASKGMTSAEYNEVEEFVSEEFENIVLPEYRNLERGGIIGEVEVVDCVTMSASPWFFGKYGFVLKNPKPIPFKPCRGQLGFFRI
jgi:hypothetical protein